MKAQQQDSSAELSFIINDGDKSLVSQRSVNNTQNRVLEHVTNGTDVILVTSARHHTEPVSLERYFSENNSEIRSIYLNSSVLDAQSDDATIDLDMISTVVYESIHLDTHFAVIIDDADQFPIQALNQLIQLALGVNTSKNNVNFIFSGGPDLLSKIEQISDIKRLSLAHCSLDVMSEHDIQTFINIKQTDVDAASMLEFSEPAMEMLSSFANGSLHNASIALEWIRLYSSHIHSTHITSKLIDELLDKLEALDSTKLFSDYPPQSFQFSMPEPAMPEPAMPEPAMPEPAMPEPAMPEPAMPEPAMPELAMPELVMPEPVMPDSETTQSARAEADTGNPEDALTVYIEPNSNPAEEKQHRTNSSSTVYEQAMNNKELTEASPVIAEEAPHDSYTATAPVASDISEPSDNANEVELDAVNTIDIEYIDAPNKELAETSPVIAEETPHDSYKASAPVASDISEPSDNANEVELDAVNTIDIEYIDTPNKELAETSPIIAEETPHDSYNSYKVSAPIASDISEPSDNATEVELNTVNTIDTEYIDTFNIDALKDINDPLPDADADVPISSASFAPARMQTQTKQYKKRPTLLNGAILTLVFAAAYFAWSGQLSSITGFQSLSPSDSNQTPVAPTQLTPEQAKFVAQSSLDTPTYNQQDGKISTLIDLAKQQLSDSKLTRPKGDNAFSTYKLILELQPDNKIALHGIDSIKQRYINMAIRDINRGRITRAKRYLSRAAKIAPRDSETIQLIANLK